MMQPKLAPSILSANFANLEKDIREVEKAGCTYLHVDIMDGHFVPNISMGPPIVKALKAATSLILDTHLMISEPAKYIESFAKAGSDIITIHSESNGEIEKNLQIIKQCGKKAGLTIKPSTPITTIEPYLDLVDLVLIMSVEPGFGGQSFIPASLEKIKQARALIDQRDIILEIDGGIKLDNVQQVIDAGIDLVVAGSAVFKNPLGIYETCKAFQGNMVRK